MSQPPGSAGAIRAAAPALSPYDTIPVDQYPIPAPRLSVSGDCASSRRSMPIRSASCRLCCRSTQFSLRGWWLFLRSTSSVYHAGSISTVRTRPATSSTSVPRTVKSSACSPPSRSTTTRTGVERPLSRWSRIVILVTSPSYATPATA